MSQLLRIPPLAVRARRRPWAVVLAWTWEAGLGLAVGSSFASVAGIAYGRRPGGFPLFQPGGVALLDFLRHAAAARGPLVVATLVVILLSRVGGLVPSAAVVAELSLVTRAHRAPPLRDALAVAFAAFPASASVELVVMGAEALLWIAGIAIGAAASGWATPRYGEPRGDLLLVSVLLATAVLVTSIGVIGDIARAAVVRDSDSALEAVSRSVERFRGSPFQLLLSYGARALASWVPVAFGVALSSRVDEGRPAILLVVVLLHQLIVAVRAAIQTSWLARAVRALRAPAYEASDR